MAYLKKPNSGSILKYSEGECTAAYSESDKNFPVKIFLAGSIEMGVAEDWQKRILDKSSEFNSILFYNPRRDEWDSSWKQEIGNPQFNHQVSWELNRLDEADFIFMYFSPETKSPISLLELGLYAKSGKMVVCCPGGFWRKGNVDIVCTRLNVPLYDDFDDAFDALMTKVRLKVS